MTVSSLLNQIRTGHVLMVLCCIFYLIWWSITFNPVHPFPSLPKYLLFFLTFGCGMAGTIRIIQSIAELPELQKTVSCGTICITGVIFYFALMYLTGHFLHRQVTTELLLIVGWTVLEVCVLSRLYGADAMSLQTVVILTAVSIIGAVLSMICYLAYYQLPPLTAFYDGMVPLILCAAVMTLLIFLLHS